MAATQRRRNLGSKDVYSWVATGARGNTNNYHDVSAIFPPVNWIYKFSTDKYLRSSSRARIHRWYQASPIGSPAVRNWHCERFLSVGHSHQPSPTVGIPSDAQYLGLLAHTALHRHWQWLFPTFRGLVLVCSVPNSGSSTEWDCIHAGHPTARAGYLRC